MTDKLRDKLIGAWELVAFFPWNKINQLVVFACSTGPGARNGGLSQCLESAYRVRQKAGGSGKYARSEASVFGGSPDVGKANSAGREQSPVAPP
jgi:hypothetical protein